MLSTNTNLTSFCKTKRSQQQPTPARSQQQPPPARSQPAPRSQPPPARTGARSGARSGARTSARSGARSGASSQPSTSGARPFTAPRYATPSTSSAPRSHTGWMTWFSPSGNR